MKHIISLLVVMTLVTGCSISTNSKSSNHIGSVYSNEVLGFSLTFPEAWQDHYEILEGDNEIHIYFIGESNSSKPTEDSPVEGLYFFSIGSEQVIEEYGELVDSITEVGTARDSIWYYYTGIDCSICVLASSNGDSKDESARMNDWDQLGTMQEQIEEVISSFRGLSLP